MNRSLSLVLPIYNAQRELAEDLQHLFDVLADFAERFEILLIDQGSTDQTVEVARELALQYPQVRLVQRTRRPGLARIIDNPLSQATGDIVIVQSGHGGVRPGALRRLWEMDASTRRQPAAAAGLQRPRRRLPGQPPCPPAIRYPDCEIDGLRMIRRG